MTQTVAANGYRAIELPEDNLPKVFGNNGTNITTMTVVYNGFLTSDPWTPVPSVTYVKTLTYTTLGSGTVISNESQWTPQA